MLMIKSWRRWAQTAVKMAVEEQTFVLVLALATIWRGDIKIFSAQLSSGAAGASRPAVTLDGSSSPHRIFMRSSNLVLSCSYIHRSDGQASWGGMGVSLRAGPVLYSGGMNGKASMAEKPH